MRKRILAGVLTVGMGVTGSAALAQPPGTFRPNRPAEGEGVPGSTDQPSWWANWFGGQRPAETAHDRPAPNTPDRSPRHQARELERCRNAYLRRLAVCDRLREIALQTNDTTLDAEAEKLETLAWSLLDRQTHQLLGSPAGPIDGPASASASATLQKNSPGGAAGRTPVRQPANAGLGEGER